MRKDWKYIAYIGSAILLFVLVKLLSPSQHDWTVTFAHGDKNPYGGYALNQLLPTIFDGNVVNSYQTAYELRDSLPGKNLLILASTFSAGKPDTDVLLEHVSKGGTVLISAQYFQGHFADTLGISTYDYFFSGADINTRQDSAALKLVNHHLDTTTGFYYRRDNIHSYFDQFDTTRTTVLAVNEQQQPVSIRVVWDQGYFVLNSTPLIFTNINLLTGRNHALISSLFSTLPNRAVAWTEFYHLGRMEVTSPLRFVLTNEPLRWGYYITIFSVILFMLFESKRRQRIIPVIMPLANTTLDFVKTIGTLYYQSQDHRNLALKKIHYLKDLIHSKFWMDAYDWDDQFVETLALKSGKDRAEVEELRVAVRAIQSNERISAQALMDFNRKMEKFTSGLL